MLLRYSNAKTELYSTGSFILPVGGGCRHQPAGALFFSPDRKRMSILTGGRLGPRSMAMPTLLTVIQ